jgi:hypothetical protein
MLISVTDTDNEVSKPAVLRAVRLGKPSRITAFVLGFAGLAAGGVAVFVTHLEAGPVGLMAVGLIFMIIALGGVLPTRLKWGESEATWGEIERQAVETFVERVAEVTPVKNQREFLGALSDLAVNAPRVAGPALSAYAYEQLVMSMLGDAVKTIGEDISLPRQVVLAERGPVRGPDAVISAADGRTLIVELKVSQKISAREILRQLERFRSEMPGSGLRGALVVSKHPIWGSEMLTDEPYTYYIVVEGREDQNRLTRVVRQAFAALATAHSDGRKD